MQGAEFELYKQTAQSTGSTTWIQVKWTDEDTGEEIKTITSDINGIIPNLDNKLEPGTYQLREEKAPNEYLSLTEEFKNDESQNHGYINFTVSSKGVITLGAHPDVVDVVNLNPPEAGKEAVYKLTIPNKRIIYEVGLKKVDEHAKPLLGSRFELTKKADKTWIKVDLDPDTEGDQNEIDLTTVSEKTLRLKNGLYQLKETTTHSGYVIQSTDIHFIVQDGVVDLTDADGNAIYDENGNLTVEDNPYVSLDKEIYTDIIPPSEDVAVYSIRVWNYPGAELPRTGGPGTRFFRILGCMLICFALGAGFLHLKKTW